MSVNKLCLAWWFGFKLYTNLAIDSDVPKMLFSLKVFMNERNNLLRVLLGVIYISFFKSGREYNIQGSMRKLKLSCDSRFQRAFTACVFVFEEITLV